MVDIFRGKYTKECQRHDSSSQETSKGKHTAKYNVSGMITAVKKNHDTDLELQRRNDVAMMPPEVRMAQGAGEECV